MKNKLILSLLFVGILNAAEPAVSMNCEPNTRLSSTQDINSLSDSMSDWTPEEIAEAHKITQAVENNRIVPVEGSTYLNLDSIEQLTGLSFQKLLEMHKLRNNKLIIAEFSTDSGKTYYYANSLNRKLFGENYFYYEANTNKCMAGSWILDPMNKNAAIDPITYYISDVVDNKIRFTYIGNSTELSKAELQNIFIANMLLHEIAYIFNSISKEPNLNIISGNIITQIATRCDLSNKDYVILAKFYLRLKTNQHKAIKYALYMCKKITGNVSDAENKEILKIKNHVLNSCSEILIKQGYYDAAKEILNIMINLRDCPDNYKKIAQYLIAKINSLLSTQNNSNELNQ